MKIVLQCRHLVMIDMKRFTMVEQWLLNFLASKFRVIDQFSFIVAGFMVKCCDKSEIVVPIFSNYLSTARGNVGCFGSEADENQASPVRPLLGGHLNRSMQHRR